MQVGAVSLNSSRHVTSAPPGLDKHSKVSESQSRSNGQRESPKPTSYLEKLARKRRLALNPKAVKSKDDTSPVPVDHLLFKDSADVYIRDTKMLPQAPTRSRRTEQFSPHQDAMLNCNPSRKDCPSHCKSVNVRDNKTRRFQKTNQMSSLVNNIKPKLLTYWYQGKNNDIVPREPHSHVSFPPLKLSVSGTEKQVTPTQTDVNAKAKGQSKTGQWRPSAKKIVQRNEVDASSIKLKHTVSVPSSSQFSATSPLPTVSSTSPRKLRSRTRALKARSASASGVAYRSLTPGVAAAHRTSSLNKSPWPSLQPKARTSKTRPSSVSKKRKPTYPVVCTRSMLILRHTKHKRRYTPSSRSTNHRRWKVVAPRDFGPDTNVLILIPPKCPVPRQETVSMVIDV